MRLLVAARAVGKVVVNFRLAVPSVVRLPVPVGPAVRSLPAWSLLVVPEVLPAAVPIAPSKAQGPA